MKNKGVSLKRMKFNMRALFQNELWKIDCISSVRDVLLFLKPRTELPLTTEQDIAPTINELLIQRLEAKIS
jgi:hypothetical protein